MFPSLAAGPDRTCGVTREGEAYCWGLNMHGGSGSALPGRATAVRAGNAHGCTVVEPGALYVWGYNVHRQLESDATDRSPPDV